MKMRYLRLWWRCVVIAAVGMLEYRFNFVVRVGFGLLELVLAVLTLGLIYGYTDYVAGWSQAEVLMLVGVYRIVSSLVTLQVAPNMLAVSGYVRRGDMDFLLLRPVSSRFLVSTRLMALPAAVNALIGVGLMVYAGNLAGVRWSAAGVVWALAFMLCGLVLLYCFWFFLVTFSFWLVEVDTLGELFYGVFETARYPVTYFKGFVRTLLTFAIPVAFATTFPTQALLGAADVQLLVAGVALAVLALACTHAFWNYAVRHYSSASS